MERGFVWWYLGDVGTKGSWTLPIFYDPILHFPTHIHF